MSGGTRILRRVKQEWRTRRRAGPVDWTLLVFCSLALGYGFVRGFDRIFGIDCIALVLGG